MSKPSLEKTQGSKPALAYGEGETLVDHLPDLDDPAPPSEVGRWAHAAMVGTALLSALASLGIIVYVVVRELSR